MHWDEYRLDVDKALRAVDPAFLYALAGSLFAAWEKGRTVFTCGNGGSASAASHLAQDLAKGTEAWRTDKPLRAIALTDNVGAITAWANDTSYDAVFAEQLANLAQAGDVLIAISGSGNSENVLQAVWWANRKGLRTWAVCGFDGGKLKGLAHRHVHVPCQDMGMVEAVHSVLFHWLVQHLRALFAGEQAGLSIIDGGRLPRVGEGA